MAVSSKQNHSVTFKCEPAEMTLTERVESIKAGLVGALAAGLVFGLLTLVNHQLAEISLITHTGVQEISRWLWLIQGGIVVFSGFLFGTTYRYIIRQDQNPHLKSGAVLAFGLVRGLAQIEGATYFQGNLLATVVVVTEGILVFAIARLALDQAFARGWVTPFGIRSQIKIDS